MPRYVSERAESTGLDETHFLLGDAVVKLIFIGPPCIYAAPGSGTVFNPGTAVVYVDYPFVEKGTWVLVRKGANHHEGRKAFCAWLEEQRGQPLTEDERSEVMVCGVDLIFQPEIALIRPDVGQLERILLVDRLLQRKVNKFRLRFEFASSQVIRETLLRLGELWRIAGPAFTKKQMEEQIRAARVGLEGRKIYYYSSQTGCRFLTFAEFEALQYLSDVELHHHLLEIQDYCGKQRARGGLELAFFPKSAGIRGAIREATFAPPGAALRKQHTDLCSVFRDGADDALCKDSFWNNEWLNALYAALYPPADHSMTPDEWLGLAVEFCKHIKWLPGGQLKRGHLDFDTVFDRDESDLPAQFRGRECERGKAIILNFVRDYCDLEFINVGWINEPLMRSTRPARGHRDVYVVVMKRLSEPRHQIRILRMQKWDMSFRLDHSEPGRPPKSPEQAMFETEEYMEYTQDRYLGCQRVGVNLFGPVRVGKISEQYDGYRKLLKGMPIWTPYFERNYVEGIASDKVGEDRWQRPGYMQKFAELLGRAAAPNLIVGRGDGAFYQPEGKRLIVFFDDGDEVIVERDGMPVDLIVMHHTGSFWHYEQELCHFAEPYARPVNRRKDQLPDPAEFAEIYLNALIDRVAQLQQEYKAEQHSFDRLFQMRQPRSDGNFAHRWQCVLKRLNAAKPSRLKDAIAGHFQLSSPDR